MPLISDSLVRRYAELKREAPECVLLMQVGAFMKVLDDDARTVSEVAGLKLQMSGAIDRPVVVGGFPRSGLDGNVGNAMRTPSRAAGSDRVAARKINLSRAW